MGREQRDRHKAQQGGRTGDGGGSQSATEAARTTQRHFATIAQSSLEVLGSQRVGGMNICKSRYVRETGASWSESTWR
eukprot:7376916-Prymnesium_polylepis.2